MSQRTHQGGKARVVHDNRLQQSFIRREAEALGESYSRVPIADWEAPNIEHFVLQPQQEQQAEVGGHYSRHVWHPTCDTKLEVKLEEWLDECNVTQI